MAGRPAGEVVLRNLATFGAVLRDSGLEVGPQRLQTALRGLDAMGLRSRETVYWTLFCTLVSRREQAAAFDVAFRAFWDGLVPALAEREATEGMTDGPGGDDGDEPGGQMLGEAGDDGDEGDEDVTLGATWSAHEALRHVDFSAYGEDELRTARLLLERVRRTAPRRRSRRLRAAGAGRDLDHRRTVRSAMRTEGHPVERAWQERRLVPRRVIFLIDVSGSMEPYARALVMFAQVVRQAARKVEVFTFGTRLTRITAELAGRDARRGLARAGRSIPDWAGGTRIGESLKAFNDGAGRRGLTRGAVVVVVSDGCERGDPALVGEEMARLHRAAHSVVWVNPLAGDPRFEPLTLGMVAALPYVDRLLAGHDLAALESLAEVLEAIPERRST